MATRNSPARRLRARWRSPTGPALAFLGASSAGNAKITQTVFGSTQFGTYGGTDTSTAGNATIDNTSAVTIFAASTNAGSCHHHQSRPTAVRHFMISRRPPERQSPTVLVAKPCSADVVRRYHDRPATPSSPTTMAVRSWFQMVRCDCRQRRHHHQFRRFDGRSTAILTGGNAQFIANGTGFVSFAGSLGANGDGRITAGSIAGSGTYYIGGGNTLVVGGNNLSTTVSGVVADVDPCGCGTVGPGNLEKTGSGTLTLSGINSYTGTTTSQRRRPPGRRLDRVVEPHHGECRRRAQQASAPSVAPRSRAAVSLLPGNGTTGSAMTVAGNLAFQSGALYLVQLSSNAATSVNVTGGARARRIGRRQHRRQQHGREAIYHPVGGRRPQRARSPASIHSARRRVRDAALSYDAGQRLPELRARLRQSHRPQRQPEGGRDRVAELLRRQWRHQRRLCRPFREWPVAAFGRGRDRIAADHIQRNEPVHRDC